jgi:hypothetical protein
MNDESERQYLCLVYHDDATLAATPERELDGIVAECVQWIDDLERQGRHIYSAGLESIRSATTLKHRNGKVTTTDGPFAETKEYLGGFTLFRARDLNEAIAIASTLPAARINTIEVRPVLRSDTHSSDPTDRKVADSLRRISRAALQPLGA